MTMPCTMRVESPTAASGPAQDHVAEHDEDGRAEAHERVGAQARRAAAIRSLEADQRAGKKRGHGTQQEFVVAHRPLVLGAGKDAAARRHPYNDFRRALIVRARAANYCRGNRTDARHGMDPIDFEGLSEAPYRLPSRHPAAGRGMRRPRDDDESIGGHGIRRDVHVVRSRSQRGIGGEAAPGSVVAVLSPPPAGPLLAVDAARYRGGLSPRVRSFRGITRPAGWRWHDLRPARSSLVHRSERGRRDFAFAQAGTSLSSWRKPGNIPTATFAVIRRGGALCGRARSCTPNGEFVMARNRWTSAWTASLAGLLAGLRRHDDDHFLSGHSRQAQPARRRRSWCSRHTPPASRSTNARRARTIPPASSGPSSRRKRA